MCNCLYACVFAIYTLFAHYAFGDHFLRREEDIKVQEEDIKVQDNVLNV